MQVFDPSRQANDPISKLLITFEKIAEVLRALQWEQAQKHKISPLQLQVLLFLRYHPVDLRKNKVLAKEFSVTRATLSDTIKTLLSKGLLFKETDPKDSRSSFLHLSAKGEQLCKAIGTYPQPFEKALEKLDPAHLSQSLAQNLLILETLSQSGHIHPPRMCFRCQHYAGNRQDQHFCHLLNQTLPAGDLRIDCPEFASPL